MSLVCLNRSVLVSLVAASLLAMLGVDVARGQTSRSGTGRTAQQLAQPVSLTWQEVPLGDALDRIAGTQSIAVWRDRRVDPNVPINLTVADQPLGEVLAALGEQAGAVAVPFGGIIYFGPQQTADELATIAELARAPLAKAPAAARNAWLKPQAWTSPRLSQPRELLNQLVADADAKVVAADRIPHDLWPARDLPATAAIDRAVLLLAGFDLTCRLSADGSQLEVAPIERPVVVNREYRIAPSRAAAFQAALAGMPTVTANGEGSRQTIAARSEEHDALRAALAGRPVGGDPRQAAAPRRTPRPSGESPLEARRFTLTIENKPLAPVLAQLASQLQLQVDWDAAIPDTAEGRNALVSCQVEKVNLDGLLEALLTPAGLAFERNGASISIRRQ